MYISTVRVFVRDLVEAEDFYAAKLALPRIAGDPRFGYVVFQTGAVQFVVESVPNDAPQDEQVLVGRFTGLSFSVESVESTYQELKRLGVHFTGAPERQAWGGILATLQDPAGNELQLVQLPSAA